MNEAVYDAVFALIERSPVPLSAWTVIDWANEWGIGELETRRAIWRLVAEQRVTLSSDRKLSVPNSVVEPKKIKQFVLYPEDIL